MKRIWLAVIVPIFCLASAPSAWAMSWKEVASLHQDGVADSLIIQKIIYSGQVFELEAKDIRDLKKAGVSDEVISVMLRTEAQDQGEESDNGDYHGHSSTHVSLGFGFGYYGGYWPYYAGYWPYYGYYGPYYGHYYTPSYRHYYAPRYYGGYYRPGYNYGYARPRSYVNYGAARPRYNYYSQPRYGHPGSPAARHR